MSTDDDVENGWADEDVPEYGKFYIPAWPTFSFTSSTSNIDSEIIKLITGWTDRKVRRYLTKHARRQRHLAYQSSRKIRRR